VVLAYSGDVPCFLQNFRAKLIPTLAVTVVILNTGTFGVLSLFRLYHHILTMFAMVLANA